MLESVLFSILFMFLSVPPELPQERTLNLCRMYVFVPRSHFLYYTLKWSINWHVDLLLVHPITNWKVGGRGEYFAGRVSVPTSYIVFVSYAGCVNGVTG